MTKRELENFCWKWERHIRFVVLASLFVLICAIAWFEKH